jgi:hypothetical protein
VVCVPDISLKNNEYIKTLFLEAQAAYSDLEYAETFTPKHNDTGIKTFYDMFSKLFNCTKYLIKKNLLPDSSMPVESDDIKTQEQLILDTEKWFKKSSLDKINLGEGKRLFKEYSWLVVNNLF